MTHFIELLQIWMHLGMVAAILSLSGVVFFTLIEKIFDCKLHPLIPMTTGFFIGSLVVAAGSLLVMAVCTRFFLT